MNMEKRLETMMSGLPERERWRMVQSAIDLRLDWPDAAIRRLDARMQGLLFLQDHIRNAPARIAFVRDRRNMAYLRDAAGSRNVCMSDAEFGELVEENDSETLAGFGRCEAMQPHHLLYIEHQLDRLPHRQPALASAYDVRITARKVLETTGATREVALLRLARAALCGPGAATPAVQRRIFSSIVHPASEPRSLWRAYLNLSALEPAALTELLEGARGSSSLPPRTSRNNAPSVH
ncbi:MAG: hypothetical protein P8Y54_14235 [Xanthomonadales bacterium]